MKKLTFKCGENFLMANTIDTGLKVSKTRYVIYCVCPCCNCTQGYDIDFGIIPDDLGICNDFDNVAEYLGSLTADDFYKLYIMNKDFYVANLLVFV